MKETCVRPVQNFMPQHHQPCRACEDLRVFLARWKDVGQHPRHVKRSLPPGGAIRRTCSCALQLQAHIVHCYVLIRTVATSSCALLGAHMHSSIMHWLLLCSLQLCLLQGNWLARNVAPGRRHQASREDNYFIRALADVEEFGRC